MIEITRGNILEAETEALVNTVNCVGYMGKGIALQFKKAYPENYESYRKACDTEQVKPGRMHVYETGSVFYPKYIINFPTKRHWRGKSRLEDIKSGLNALVIEIKNRKIKSIAVPPLGCGLGGLDWRIIRPMIERAFEALNEVHIKLYEPSGAPKAKDMPVHTKRPHLTAPRALFIKIMQQYEKRSYRLTLLEIQKLAYFLQEAGEPLRLRYEAGIYGPYAPNLNKVLEVLEGHYIRGYGDTQKPDVEISLLQGAGDEADAFLKHHQDTLSRLEKVASLIDGFETPYGMELLSSVHWVMYHSDGRKIGDDDDAIAAVHEWNDRKRKMFKPDHIRIAWSRLNEEGWL
ncbi:MAG: macro domain-containing protein [Deltaproteobacteria bacterium]|nr:macro domain-containing protein [Deltaproteobacteria bacterium]MDX9762526.1 macro domain-containing protein [Desulfomonilia bacterium]